MCQDNQGVFADSSDSRQATDKRTRETSEKKEKKRDSDEGGEVAVDELLIAFDVELGVGDFDIAMPADAAFVSGDRWGGWR
ncbi:hypothetical protein RB195_021211 [Necator americanus]|uniref:Uncharacterized protein n=1 Tax=Necator americanus TaxID=51031 RepID=A0ABR1EAA2_NECAM